MQISRISILFFIIFLSNGCDENSVCNQKEISRKSSPDSIVDALVIQENCGATTSYSYKVYIVPNGENPFNNFVFLSDKTDKLEVSWLSSKSLSITYDKARIFEYRNFWQSRKVDNSNYIVSINEGLNP